MSAKKIRNNLQFIGVSGVGAQAVDAVLQAPSSARGEPSDMAHPGNSNRSRTRRRRFVDDQAAGGDSSGSEGNSDSSSPNQPGHHQHSSQHGSRQAAADAPVDISKNSSSSSSSSSEDDRPLAAKRHRSTSLQRQSPASESDSFSSPSGTPAQLADSGVIPGPAASLDDAQGHQQRVWRRRTSLRAPDAKRHQQASRHDSSSAKEIHRQLQISSPAAAGTALPPSHDRQPTAPSLGRAGNPRQEGEGDREQDEGAVSSGEGGAGDEQPAVMVPSQMPRELQSWAWDK